MFNSDVLASLVAKISLLNIMWKDLLNLLSMEPHVGRVDTLVMCLTDFLCASIIVHIV